MRTSDSDPTSSQVMSGVVVKPSRRTLGCTRAMAALKSPIVMARPLRPRVLWLHFDAAKGSDQAHVTQRVSTVGLLEALTTGDSAAVVAHPLPMKQDRLSHV